MHLHVIVNEAAMHLEKIENWKNDELMDINGSVMSVERIIQILSEKVKMGSAYQCCRKYLIALKECLEIAKDKEEHYSAQLLKEKIQFWGN